MTHWVEGSCILDQRSNALSNSILSDAFNVIRNSNTNDDINIVKNISRKSDNIPNSHIALATSSANKNQNNGNDKFFNDIAEI